MKRRNEYNYFNATRIFFRQLMFSFLDKIAFFEFIVVLISLFASFVTIYSNFSDMENFFKIHWIPIGLFLILVFIISCAVLKRFYDLYNSKRDALMIIGKNLHNFSHGLRDYYFKIDAMFENLKTVSLSSVESIGLLEMFNELFRSEISHFINHLSDMLTYLSNREIYVNIKLLSPDNNTSSSKKDHFIYRFCQSSNTPPNRKIDFSKSMQNQWFMKILPFTLYMLMKNRNSLKII